ncbi:MAG: ATP-binding protein [Melioribacteraceae bacterium]|nr:ATP-binding protein [Melioribacteraceae bacterium]
MEPSQKEKIRNNKLFRNIDFDSLIIHNDIGNVCMLNYGELLYRSGEINTSLFLIINGEINLVPSQFNSANTSVIFSENDFFGVNEFISEMPRCESAIALRDTYLLEFTKEGVNELIKQSDEILANINSAIGETEQNYSSHFSETLQPTVDEEILEDNIPVVPENEITLADTELPSTIENELSKDGMLENNRTLDETEIPQIIEEENLEDDKASIPKVVNMVEEGEINSTDEKETLREDNLKNETAFEQTSTEMTFEQLERINKAAHLVNSNVKIDDVLRNIVDVSVSLCDADRGTLYLVDRSKNELWSKVLQGNEPRKITLKIGEGFAGWAAGNKEVVNIENASSDSRFNDAFDRASGYKTKSVLCFPIKNKNDDVLGVIQLLNSKKDIFTKLEENFLNALSTHAAMALQNADLVEQLLKTERISSLGKMANFLIEDIKKPILVSKRYTEHLKKKELSTDVENVVEMLLEQLNNIADIVQATSNYSHGESVLKSNDVSINETLLDFINRVNSIVQSMNCKIITKFDSDVQINMDTKEFYQGFKHIIKNACEAMPDGGDINVTTAIEDGNIKIVIKDNGMGIPVGFSEKIFEPFMSYGKKTGTGLGLSVTRKIIEEHGGTILATSELGIGSVFTISLPIEK